MFESSLIQAKGKSKWRVLPLSVGLHLAAAGAVLSAAYWQVDDLREPMLNEVFFVSAAPPAPPAPEPQTQRSAAPLPPRGDRLPVRPEVAQPNDVPDAPAAPSDEPDSGAQLVNLEPTTSTGRVGVPWGDPDADPNVPFKATDGLGGDGDGGGPTNLPIRVFGAVTRPEIIPGTRVEPRYTEGARKIRLSGAVILEAIIDEHGNVTNVEVLKGLPQGLDRAAVEAVSKWKFRPARLEGRAVKVFYTLTVRFELR